MQVDVNMGLDDIWSMEDLVKNEHVTCARVTPFVCDKPTTHPLYYPLYAKCCELDLPLSMNTGIPGSPSQRSEPGSDESRRGVS